MIPEQLVLTNFMCYKDATLDLSGVHLACLSGDNGAGKSTILDAITWAVWGKARAADDDLISQNELETGVDFEFSIGSSSYRINRRRNRKSGGHTALNLYARKDDGSWSNIGETGVRAVEKQILNIVRTSYDTFTNSAFLIQGRADAFTTRTPGERKKVLAEILELGQYDDYEKQARKQEDEAKALCKRLEEDLNALQYEIGQKAEYEEAREKAEKQLEEARDPLLQHEENLNLLKSAQSQLKSSEQKLAETRQKLAVLKKSLENLQVEKSKAQQQVNSARPILERREEIEQGFGEYQKARQAEEEFRSKWQQYNDLINNQRNLENTINRALTQLEAALKSKEASLETLNKQIEALPALKLAFETLQGDLKTAIQAAEQYEQKKNERAGLQSDIKQMEAETKRLVQELARVKAKADRVPQPGDRCEQCGTVLDESAREHTLGEYRREYADFLKQKNEIKARSEQLLAQVVVLDRDITSLEANARQYPELIRKKGQMESQIHVALEAERQASRLQEELGRLKQQLAAGDYARQEQQQLDGVITAIDALGYDEAGHKKARDFASTLARFESEKTRLAGAEQTLAREQEALKRYFRDEERYTGDLALEETALNRLQAEIAGLPDINQQVVRLEIKVRESKNAINIFQKQVWDAEKKIENCEKLAREKEELAKKHTKAAEDKSLYGDLAEAFGKKGIQALVIDTVLPELEDETNHLLDRMTDGRMHVRFKTQRNSKKGEAIETLDLDIADEQGFRPYELFSGGEAFRVNFAVRIALSKLLARRSGAQLRALFIDEGFGSQDGQGRERLVEAIRSIENDFDRILVITHIQELKDVFPVRIDVVKTPSGSQININ